ncbi:acyltransferase family protein [Armatimonas rosea]|uniref:Peptidoglycan/LPS O-acetylase OafA/YrhL n=1 Tax=Armatimonas rosea TaxID=685828 RepID=A0A7W9SML6_ARMRO|nr:acyltransferase [Armatimonas rosea]MBB6049415.1 peptidoglycan/LPS O-acetylase OafA/YrhL [Armatimonas rosea]
MPQTAHTPKPDSPPEHLAFVDFLRGVACLWVVVFHANGWQVLPDWRSTDPLVSPLATVGLSVAQLGYLGVHLFLVLSGFCLTYPVLRRAGGDLSQTRLNLREFAVRRARRILPPYYVALALVALVALTLAEAPMRHPVIGWGWDVLAHAFLVHNLSSKTVLTLNGSFWSLGLEAQWYVAFPLVLAWARRKGWLAPALGTLVLGVAWQRLVWARLPGYPEAPEVSVGNAWLYALPARLFEFVCGMVAAQWVAKGRGRATPVLLALAGSLPLLVVATLAARGRFGVWHDHLWGIAFALMLVGLSAVPGAWFAGRVPRLLVGVGTVSYSLYLVHEPLIAFTSVFTELFLKDQFLPRVAIFWGGLLPFCLLTARVFYHCFEAPWLKKKAPALAVVSQDATAGAAHLVAAGEGRDQLAAVEAGDPAVVEPPVAEAELTKARAA